MVSLGFLIWGLMILAFAAFRYPAMRKARKQRTRQDRRDVLDISLLGLCVIGLLIVPLIWRLTDIFSGFDTMLSPLRVLLGIVCAGSFLWLFWRSHKDLGKNWSVSLELREGHQLVTNGVYRHVRHPMYAAFFLWGLAQAFLLANNFAAVTGFVAVLLLYVLRHGREEAMMRDAFGANYEAYSKSTKRLIPGIY
ncbi:MAG: protein-S-isoprenylcysteine O-methyltransferase [Pseudomonadota bacterium]